MNRAGFLKSLITLIAAPSILSKIDFSPTETSVEKINATKRFVSDLQLLTPQYYKQFTEKYGNENFTLWLQEYGGMTMVDNGNIFKFHNGIKTCNVYT